MVNVFEFQEHQYDEKCMALKAKCFLEFIGHSAKESRERERALASVIIIQCLPVSIRLENLI